MELLQAVFTADGHHGALLLMVATGVGVLIVQYVGPTFRGKK